MRGKTRIEAVQAVMDGRLSVAQAATALGLSERRLDRCLAAAREEGLTGLIHGNRGRAPWDKSDEARWARVLRLVRQRYTEVNDQHLCESLEREHSAQVHPEALRRRLRAAGLAPKRQRRARKFRQRRERDGGVEVHHERQAVTRFLPSTSARLIRKNAKAKRLVA